MSTFVLVHGSWHGAWCWYKLVPLLEAAGHRVVAVDLPGLGTDKTEPADVTLQMWHSHVSGVISEQAEPVILVGHSRGGLVISGAAEQTPDKVAKLVYLTAFLLPSGKSMIEAAGEDTDSQAGGHLQMHEEEGYVGFDPTHLKETFYADCSDEDVALARLCIQPEPLAPLVTPLQVSEAAFGSVPRVYIECLQDKAISASKQKAMYTALPCEQVITMDTAHSPFFSAADELAGHLLSL